MIFLKNVNYKVVYFVIFAFGSFLLGANSAQAASLHFSPSSGDVTVGNIINVSVVVNTQGQAINNADATINFPTSLLEVVSITKTGSIFTLWVEEPSYSNISGRISFNGGLPTPGYNGATGRLINIAFRVRSAGTASLLFAGGSVRANDGLGTDILNTLGSAVFSISPAVIPVPQPEPEPEPQPQPEPEPEPKPVPKPTPTVIPTEKPVEAPRVVIVEGPLEKMWNALTGVSLANIILAALVVALAASLGLLLYGRRRFVHLRSKVRRDAHDVEKVLHKSFETINKDIAACVDLFEQTHVRRRLTDEEEAVVDLLKQHLRNTEKLVAKEVRKVRGLAEE